jgi:putative transposase
MARLARIVVPGILHHVTQRGNGRQQTFFCDDDYAFYRNLLRQYCAEHGVGIWGWVLMPSWRILLRQPGAIFGQ